MNMISHDGLIIYSAGSSIIVDFEECCLKNHLTIQAIVRNDLSAECFSTQQDKLITVDKLTERDKQYGFIVPLFTPKNRFLASQEASRLGLSPYPILSFQNNSLPTFFSHGPGCFINAGVTIGACTQFGAFVLVNRGVSLGHHANLADYVSIGPSATVCGNVTVKKGAVIGAGAVILPNVIIGCHAKVGAGAIVTKNINDGEVVVGNPARYIKLTDSLEVF